MDPYVVGYRPEWVEQFRHEGRAIGAVLGGWLVAEVQHVGSTAVPGMPAKPIIDMIAAVRDPGMAAAAAGPLAVLGYAPRPHRSDAQLYVRVGPNGDTHHLHLTTTDTSLWRERLAFRDTLRRDPALAAEYRALKQRLLASRDGAGYSGADKRDFVRRVLQASGTTLPDGMHVDLRPAPPAGLVRVGLRGENPYTGRELVAHGVDLALTLGAFFGVPRALAHGPVADAFPNPLLLGVAAGVLVSFVNRVVLPWVFRASIGKALGGLRVVRPRDAGRPSLLELLRSWSCSFGYALAEESGTATWRFMLGSARRRPLEAYLASRGGPPSR